MTTYSVYIIRDRKAEPQKLFCLDCRTPVCQFYGKLTKIVAGDGNTTPIVSEKCRSRDCDAIYNIYNI